MIKILVFVLASFITFKIANASQLRALNKSRYIGAALEAKPLKENEYKSISAENFDSITPANQMKWSSLVNHQKQYNWSESDQLMKFAQQNNQTVRGHPLVWHNQIPKWLNFLDKTELNIVLRQHIESVVTRYKGKIYAWDVINEVIEWNGRFRDSIWYKNFNQTYISQAFLWAHAIDPDAKLYINDYNIEAKNAKSDGLYELVSELINDNIPIHGVGFQSHFIVGRLPEDFVDNMQRFADLGLDVAITELDIRIQLPITEEKLKQQAEDYATAFRACQNVSKCVGVTIWGVTDRHSWIPSHFKDFGSGLPWDYNYNEKIAVSAIEAVLKN